MSEKELRDAAKRLEHACTTQSRVAVEAMLSVNKALADPPDVVRVVQLLDEWASEQWESDSPCGGEIWSALVGYEEALADIFGFRLIDEPPGWEWVEESNENL